MLPIISVVIPCYNSGEFLPDAIESVKQYNGSHKVEVIIVDDGSTDAKTLALLEELSSKDYLVIHQTNKGPAAARNTGIKNANSEFILFLDSDNMIYPEYIDEGIAALQINPDAAVVHGNPSFFGEETAERFDARAFDIQSMLAWNYIDMCAVIRKSVWEQVGGLDEERKLIGHEDWEFWLNIYKLGWKFIHLNKFLFKYRIRSGSLITQTSPEIFKRKVQYIFNKHADLVYNQYLLAVGDSITYKKDTQRPIRSFFKYFKMKYLK